MKIRSIPKIFNLVVLIFLATACHSEESTSVPALTEFTPTVAQITGTDTTQEVVTPIPTSLSPTESSIVLAARVNGEGIPLAVYEAELRRFEANSGTGLATYTTEIVLDTLIDDVLLAQAARNAGFLVSDELLETRIQALGLTDQALEEWLQANDYTPEDFRRALELAIQAAWMRDQIISNVADSAEQVYARQILQYNLSSAEAIHAQLESGDDFGAVATEVDPITKGDLGWFPRGYLIVPELDDILFTLEIGTYSPVIETALGYHIVQVLDRSLDRPLTAEARRVLQTQALAQWLENERNKSEIIILLP